MHFYRTTPNAQPGATLEIGNRFAVTICWCPSAWGLDFLIGTSIYQFDRRGLTISDIV